jgi:nucleotide-binding universal stress UspA family protein
MSDTVLIGFDGSEGATQAIRRTGPLLAPRPATVACVWQSFAQLVLHEDVDGLTGMMSEAAAEFDAEALESAERIAADGVAIATEVGFQATPLAARGKPKAWPTLLALADQQDAAAIVVGGRGVGALKAAIIGSVASGVLRHSARPVLVVPPDQGLGVPTGPIVVAYDGSEHAKRAIAAAGRLMPGRAALVRTVWTSFAGVAAASHVAIPAGVGAVGSERIDSELSERADATAEAGAELAREAGLDAVGESVRADVNVSHTLLEATRTEGVAAIVAGSRGRSVIKDVLLGSVSGGLVQRSPVPVLVVPIRG